MEAKQNLQKKRLSSSTNLVYLFLLIALLFGGYLRLAPVLSVNFPLNDGGMFYVMIQDLLANHFHLPLFTTYNHLNIPYAYPPLGFYLAAGLNYFFKINLLDVLRIVPAIFATLSIFAFFLLAHKLTRNKFQLILALLIFAFMPASFDWIIMGGGISRAMAFFFSLLDLYFIYLLFTTQKPMNTLWVALFSSLVILSHPESAIHTAAGALVFFLFLGRSKKNFLRSLFVVGLILIFTSPWWLHVVKNFGLSPVFSAAKTGLYSLNQIPRLFHFDFTAEYGVKISGALSLIGLFWYIQKKKYFIPVWVAFNFLIEPRSATLYLTTSMALLASFALQNIFVAFIGNQTSVDADENDDPNKYLNGLVVGALFIILCTQWIYSSFSTSQTVKENTLLSQEDRTAFAWIKENTPPQSSFLILSNKSPLIDQISEWFPALSERNSVATIQGYEWLSAYDFNAIRYESSNAQKCFSGDFACITTWLDKNQKQIDYIYVHNPAFSDSSDGSAKYQYSTLKFYYDKNSLTEIYNQGSIVIYQLGK